ncbi:thiazole biosynthesis protein ThiH [Klebsiella quasipneumoniae]|nr:thiazole biosynthesis protein ThiH [Klebsiella quasipneumoniae]
MMALLSPAAAGYLEPLAQRAQRLTASASAIPSAFYVPLYLSNLCANDCTYCGFSMSNRIKRKTLDAAEIARECAAIRDLGFEHLLLVTGGASGQGGNGLFPPAPAGNPQASLPRCRWRYSRWRPTSMPS